MLRLSSLSTRLVVAVVVTATLAFAVSFGLTIIRLDRGLERQAAQLARLSEEKLGERLDGEARLAGARVVTLFANVGARLESIAQRADVVKALASGNDVEISELLGRAAEAADIDGILVVDAKLRVFGADNGRVDMVAANAALQASVLAPEIRAILAENERKRPRVVRRTLLLDQDIGKALGTDRTAPLAVVVVEPIFDDFGDVFAALIAHRSLQAREPTLEEFSRLEGAGLAVVAGDRAISIAGIPAAVIGITSDESSLLRTDDGRYWSRCSSIFEAWRICSLVPVVELYALHDELVRIGEMEGRSLATWLIIVAVVSLLGFAVIMLSSRNASAGRWRRSPRRCARSRAATGSLKSREPSASMRLATSRAPSSCCSARYRSATGCAPMRRMRKTSRSGARRWRRRSAASTG